MTFLDVGASGLAGARSVSLGRLEECPEVATNSRGDVILAGFTDPTSPIGSADGGIVRAASTIPGRSADAVADIDTTEGYIDDMAIAVDEQGQALLVWSESDDDSRLRGSWRQPDGTWGTAFDIVPPQVNDQPDNRLVAVAPDGSGGFTLAWVDQSVPVEIAARRAADVFVASFRDGTLGPVSKLGRTDFVTALEMRATPDGRILVAYDGRGKIQLHEHTSGAAGFRALPPLTSAGRRLYAPSLDLAPDGSAVAAAVVSSVALFSAPPRFKVGLSAWTRRGEQPFGGEQVLKPLQLVGPRSFVFDAGSYTSRGAKPPSDDEAGKPRARLAPDRRVLVTWSWPTRTRDGDRPNRTFASLGTLDGGFGRSEPLGSLCRDNTGTAPLLTELGPIAAWADNLSSAGDEGTQPSGHGLVHLSRPAVGGSTADPPKARLRIKPQSLEHGQALRARASCDRACELRAFIVDRRGREVALGSAYLARRGTVPLVVETVNYDYHVSGGRSGRVRVRLHACSPGSRSMTSTSAVGAVRAVPPRPAQPSPR
jgi:hypothetical protein